MDEKFRPIPDFPLPQPTVEFYVFVYMVSNPHEFFVSTHINIRRYKWYLKYNFSHFCRCKLNTTFSCNFFRPNCSFVIFQVKLGPKCGFDVSTVSKPWKVEIVFWKSNLDHDFKFLFYFFHLKIRSNQHQPGKV